jgi:uncharacterized protein YqiB (DUF1249 family)
VGYHQQSNKDMSKPTKPKLNVRLLRKVQKAILKHANQFRMEWWTDCVDSKGNPAGGCGTAACIGGWAIMLGKRFKTVEAVAEISGVDSAAADLLHVSRLSPLFFLEDWPTEYRRLYWEARTAKAAARAAVRRIDHFIKTGK